MIMGIVSNAIEVDYQAAVRKSNQLYSLGDQLEKQVTKEMDMIEQQLHSGWKGDARDEYLRKHLQIRRKLLKHARDLKNEAGTIRQIADNIKRVEDVGLGLFK